MRDSPDLTRGWFDMEVTTPDGQKQLEHADDANGLVAASGEPFQRSIHAHTACSATA
jgi:hypothetical protein